jgi:hypothetical protein
VNGFVHIIESPSPSDLLDGRTEGRALSEAMRLADIPHWYSLAVDRASLREALGPRLGLAYETLQKLPIVHLSMHGNADGIALTNGEFLSWHDLRTELLPLLRIMRGTLLICLSSCSGGSGCRMAMYEDAETPFWALVGNSMDTRWADAAIAYITFYHLFFKDQDVASCVEAMRVASGDPNFVIFDGAHTRESWLAFQRQQRTQAIVAALQGLNLNAPAAGSSPPPAGLLS